LRKAISRGLLSAMYNIDLNQKKFHTSHEIISSMLTEIL